MAWFGPKAGRITAMGYGAGRVGGIQTKEGPKMQE